MKCPHCPVAGSCVGERHGFACRMATGSESERRWVVDASGSPTPPPPEYPPLATQAANLAGAVGRFAASGFATVSKREYRRRRAICEGCPLYDAAQDRCAVCGCAMAVKPWSKAERCPEGKW